MQEIKNLVQRLAITPNKWKSLTSNTIFPRPIINF